ncbi:hypothetical protein V6N13_049657 [Hibiscus sabdariffa]|uniref:Uncharacterized protein n=1 Tax=Hibiscus sabdariffa TaxID=183260 RepID=A0ABR2QX82_9ROSI
MAAKNGEAKGGQRRMPMVTRKVRTIPMVRERFPVSMHRWRMPRAHTESKVQEAPEKTMVGSVESVTSSLSDDAVAVIDNGKEVVEQDSHHELK